MKIGTNIKARLFQDDAGLDLLDLPNITYTFMNKVEERPKVIVYDHNKEKTKKHGLF